MKVSEFNYNLPEELIAQVPLEKRDESRLMILDREKQTIEHKVFKDILDYLQPGDCLVRNNTKVIPARIYGKKETGAHVEFLLLNNIEGDIWESIVRPGNKLHIGTKVIFGEGLLEAEILNTMPGGTRKVQFKYKGIFNEILEKIGLMPLPPYIHETLKENDRYQTVYAKYEGSAAAPTEGDTKIFIYPGYKFKCLDGLITNFHLPESTLLMLVSALAGREYILKAYNEAVKQEYKFFSFGDAMFIK